jgi:polyferredoxin
MASALLADLLLVAHVAVVVFIVGGLVAIAVGGALDWGWVRRFWWRVLHLAAMGFVAVGAVVGWVCPLTVWEDALRRRAGEAEYGTGFVQYWMERLLYHDWPGWVFTVLYLAVFGAILAAWRLVPPRRDKSR